jgi:hypothetical protein
MGSFVVTDGTSLEANVVLSFDAGGDVPAELDVAVEGCTLAGCSASSSCIVR